MRLIDADALIEFCTERRIPLYIDVVNLQPTIYPIHPDVPDKDVGKCSEIPNSSDTISRQAAIDEVKRLHDVAWENWKETRISANTMIDALKDLPSAQPEQEKYEYHYDHTDCIWYRPEARNRCPVTCAQYRDGWNDAMNYIFRDGKGYRPYRRDEQYGE